uniref:E1B protein, small T-antigen n=1 Tax=Lygus hesperus TaxID=30085 RepID=A0A0A9WGW0_LYGHE
MIGIQRRRAQALQALGRRKFVTVVVVSLLLYIFLSPKVYDVTFDGVVPSVDPTTVCNFLADFNNVKRLNPTIENFSITSDNGDYHLWEYSVFYTEHLSNFPFIKNSAHAHYKVYHTRQPDEECVIESNHRTCFIGRFLCVDSLSKFICREKEKSTYCREEVNYECPRLASIFCHSEVMFQRRAIFRNLILELSSPS